MDEELKKKPDSRDFYELCQAYRHAKDGSPIPMGMPTAAEAFDHIREYLLTGNLPWESYETSAD